MPKIVDHAQRRDEIAQVACQVVAAHGFEQATVARIARAAGYTSGMVAHYYESKQAIILAALRLVLKRIEERLTRERTPGPTSLLAVLCEALPLDEPRFTECAFWMAFWGQVSADSKLRRLNAWVHREYMRLFARCFAVHWPEWQDWPKSVRDEVLRSMVAFINGICAGAVTSPRDWPADTQVLQLRLQLELLWNWAHNKRSREVPGRRARHAGDGNGVFPKRRAAAHHQDDPRLRAEGTLSAREGGRGERRAGR